MNKSWTEEKKKIPRPLRAYLFVDVLVGEG